MPHCAARSGLLIQRRKRRRRLALRRRRGLEQIEVAAARRTAAPLARGQHGDTERKFRVGADVRQVAGGGPDHRHLLLEEIARRGAPIDDAGRMRLILARRDRSSSAAPRRRRGWRSRSPCRRRSPACRRPRWRAPGTASTGSRWRGSARPTASTASPFRFVSFCANCGMLVPGRRRTFRVQSGILERGLVPVQHDGRTLERHAPGVAVDLAVLQERRIEAAQPGAIRVAVRQRVERHDQVVVDQREHIGGQQHRELRTGVRLQRGLRLGQGVLIGAGVDRRHLDRRVLALEVGGIAVDDLRDRSANRDREIETDIGRGVGRAADAGTASAAPAVCSSRRRDALIMRQPSPLPSRRSRCGRPEAASNMWIGSSVARCTCVPLASTTRPGSRASIGTSPTRQATTVSAPRYSAYSTRAGMPRSANRRLSGRIPPEHLTDRRRRKDRAIGSPHHHPGSRRSSGNRFIGGVPMKLAAKLVAGRA